MEPERQAIPEEGLVLAQAPLEYHFAPADGRLGVRIINPSSESVRLLGDKSYVVDPTGATHPLPGGTIAPNAHIGFILPPAPTVYRSSPRFSLGLGFGHFHSPLFYRPYYHHFWYSDPWLYGPTDFYAVNAPHQWDWRTGTVRMRFSYEDANGFDHHFTVERERVRD